MSHKSFVCLNKTYATCHISFHFILGNGRKGLSTEIIQPIEAVHNLRDGLSIANNASKQTEQLSSCPGLVRMRGVWQRC